MILPVALLFLLVSNSYIYFHEAYSSHGIVLRRNRNTGNVFPPSSARLTPVVTRMMSPLDSIGSTEIVAELAASLIGGYFLAQLAVYWRMQYVSAGLIAGIPARSKDGMPYSVVELGAADGKNVFYLPGATSGCDFLYTAVMPVERDSRIRAGRVRVKSNEIPSKSVDCVISVGAIDRVGKKVSSDEQQNAKVELLQEAFRLLRPGGLFLFSEPDGDSSFLESLYKVFPERISNKVATAGEKATRGETFSSEKKTKSKKIRNSRDSKMKKRGGDESSSSEESSATTATIEDDSVFAVDNSVNTIAATTATTTTTAEGIGMVVAADSSRVSIGDKDESTRPAVTVERLSNVFFPYITGIAVRP